MVCRRKFYRERLRTTLSQDELLTFVKLESQDQNEGTVSVGLCDSLIRKLDNKINRKIIYDISLE